MSVCMDPKVIFHQRIYEKVRSGCSCSDYSMYLGTGMRSKSTI